MQDDGSKPFYFKTQLILSKIFPNNIFFSLFPYHIKNNSQTKLFLTLNTPQVGTDEQNCNVRVSYSLDVTYWQKMKDLIGLENRKYCINQPTHC